MLLDADSTRVICEWWYVDTVKAPAAGSRSARRIRYWTGRTDCRRQRKPVHDRARRRWPRSRASVLPSSCRSCSRFIASLLRSAPIATTLGSALASSTLREGRRLMRSWTLLLTVLGLVWIEAGATYVDPAVPGWSASTSPKTITGLVAPGEEDLVEEARQFAAAANSELRKLYVESVAATGRTRRTSRRSTRPPPRRPRSSGERHHAPDQGDRASSTPSRTSSIPTRSASCSCSSSRASPRPTMRRRPKSSRRSRPR